MQKINGIPVFGHPVDEQALAQIQNCMPEACGAALMGDHHLGYSVPIGGVVVYDGMISPSGVGYDIACGNKAVRLDMDGDEARKNIKTIMDDVWKSIEFGIGRKNQEVVDHELFDSDAWRFGVASDFKDKAREQLGTVGSGNHYVDIFVDEKNRVWVGVHFGSRGLGHTLASHFIKLGGGSDGMHVKPVVFDVNSNLGADYIECMNLAGEYAYAGRDWVCSRVAQILGAPIVEEIHNHHNFAWKETHNGRDYWVVRKGATPAFPGQKGFVGGSMGDRSVILEGLESDASRDAYSSPVHGAGRIMSRTEATGLSKWGKRRVREPGVKQEDMDAWVKKVGVELRGAGVDESPQVYKRINDVLEHHEGTIKILHTLTPIGVAMAGSDTFDPYKD